MEAEEEALKSQLEDAELQKRKLDDQIVKESEKAEKLDEELERYSDIVLLVVITTTVNCVSLASTSLQLPSVSDFWAFAVSIKD